MLCCLPPHPQTIYSIKQITLTSQGFSFLGFFLICNIIFPVNNQCRYFLPNDKALILKCSLNNKHKYRYLLQKESINPSIVKIWSKNIFSFVAKMFFLQSKQMKVSSYNCIWYKSFETNISLFNFAFIVALTSEKFRLKRSDMFTSCIHVQPIMISSLGAWTKTLLWMLLPFR